MTLSSVAVETESPSARRAAAKPAPPIKARTRRRKTVPPKVTAPAAPAATPPQAPVDTWVAHFIFAADNGHAQVCLLTISAPSAEAARAIAVANAPAAEFMVSIHPRSDEQFLGQVRLKALAAAKPQS